MIDVRRREEIYHKEGGWFSASWHFSFDEYYDPQNMGFGSLRVFNDDRLVPGAVWPMHPHRDIEGLTYVVEGTFEHSDSMGNGGVLAAGSVQRATLGSGMMHSEMNHSKTEPMRFIQMWIMPRERGLTPSVEQKSFTLEDRTNVLLPAVSPDGADGVGVSVHQDAWVYLSRLEEAKSVEHKFATGFGGSAKRKVTKEMVRAELNGWGGITAETEMALDASDALTAARWLVETSLVEPEPALELDF